MKPKIVEVESNLSRFTGSGADKPDARAEIERLTTLRAEVVEFHDEFLRIAQGKAIIGEQRLIVYVPIEAPTTAVSGFGLRDEHRRQISQ